MYEIRLSSQECGFLTLRCDKREHLTDFLNLAITYSLELDVKEVKDAEPDT